MKLIQKKKRIDEEKINKNMIVDFSLRTLRKPLRSLRLNTFVPFEIFDSFVVKIIATDSQINYTANSQINLKLIQKKKRIDEKMIDKKMIVDFSLRT